MWLLFCILTLKPADEKQHGKRGAGLHVWKFVWEWACCWIRRATINLYLSDRGESARQSVRPWYICLPGRKGADTALNMCDKKRVLLSFLLGFPLLIRSPAVGVCGDPLFKRGRGGTNNLGPINWKSIWEGAICFLLHPRGLVCSSTEWPVYKCESKFTCWYFFSQKNCLMGSI